jgi:hypothetical protein
MRLPDRRLEQDMKSPAEGETTISGREIKEHKRRKIYIYANRNAHSPLKESAPFNQLDTRVLESRQCNIDNFSWLAMEDVLFRRRRRGRMKVLRFTG